MQIKDLVPKQGNVDIELEVIEFGIVREFSKFGKPGKVLTAVAKDETGKINLTLWNEQTEQVKAGDVIRIKDGYVSEWQGEKQLTTGRNGTLEVVKSSNIQNTQAKEEKVENNSEKLKKKAEGKKGKK